MSSSISAGKTPRKKGTGSIRRYANGVWQSSFTYKGQRFYLEAVSRDEASGKLEAAKQFADSGSFDGTKESLHQFLLQQGYPSGTKRTVPAVISSYNINRNTATSWRVSVNVQGVNYRIGAVSEEEARAKYIAFEAAVLKGEFHGSNESLDAILKAAGFVAGRFHSVRLKKGTSKHGPFKNGIRRRAEGYYEGRYTYHRKTESVYAPTEKEAEKKLRAIKTAIDDGSYIGKNNETLCGYLMFWVGFSGQTRLRPSTQRKYRSYVIDHFIPYFGDQRLQATTTELLQEFFQTKTISGRADGKEGGLSHKTLTDMRNMLSKALNYAVNPKRLLQFNPAREIELKFRKAKEIPIMTEDQMELLIENAMAGDNPVGWAIVILLRTGMRKGELLGLRLSCIGPRISTFSIEKSLVRIYHPNKQQAADYERIDTWAKTRNKTGLYLGPPKTESSSRCFPVGRQVKECVRNLIAYQEKLLGHSIEQCPNHGLDNFLLVTPLLRPYDPKAFEEHFKKFLSQCGILDISVHSTRHSFTTDMLEKFPEELSSISEIVGHASKSTTLRYAHGREKKKIQLMDSF
ncbi:tyrosine-type recombinase/integrase [Anaerotruncus colihominis]|uniref:Site-specific integrase n=1 Tax=Anaerotruncus colihominis TaxID=169435 RepID=A0A845SQ17_9FIRM|nr:tyrosine-type recombinase/integrase [Anaerotruncus colihominis]NDO37705.1 site-specific integrase [Anaerotruncus colihominis]